MLIGNFSFIFLLIIGIVSTTWVTLNYLEDQAYKITDKLEPQVSRMAEIEKLMIYISLEARHAILAINEADELAATVQRINNNREKLLSVMKKVEENITTEEGRAIMNRIRDSDSEFWEMGKKTMGLIKAGDSVEAFKVLRHELVPARNEQLKHIEEQKEWQQHLMNQALKDASVTATRVKFGLTAVVLVTCLAVGIVIIRFIRMTTKRLATLQNTIVKVEKTGDCTLRANIVGEDEVGRTAVAFDAMMERISKLIGETRRSADEIADFAKSMYSAGVQVEESSNAQSSSASSVSALIDQTAAGIATSASSAQAADEIAGQVRSEIDRTLSSVRETAQNVENLAMMIERATSDVTKLEASSNEIDGIVKTIKDVAERTNLLALNAAIEAARAGDQGRGFAVVADEVRKLAENTSSATREISELIDSVKAQVVSTVQGMQQANERAMVTKDKIMLSTSVLDTANANTSKVTDSVRSIANLMREQNAAAQTVAHKMMEISSMADENTRAAASAVEIAKSLDSQAGRLRIAVGQFNA